MKGVVYVVSNIKKVFTFLGVFVAIWLGLKYLLPFLLPFLFGGLLAIAAEPAVQFGRKKLKLPGSLSAGVGVTFTLLLFAALITLLGAVAVKELGHLAAVIPSLQSTAKQGVGLLEDWAVSLAAKAPDPIRPSITRSVQSLFSDTQTALTPSTIQVLSAIRNFLSALPDSALSLGTFLLSGYMISPRLPDLKRKLKHLVDNSLIGPYIFAFFGVKNTVGHWLLAQGKLAAITFFIVCIGLSLLAIPYAPAWALIIALVDAMPILGSGIILIPWALISLLQDNSLQAIGILCTYGVAVITRTTLEPRLVGRQLGLDPLVTLIFLYIGYRLLGVAGMLLAPIIAATVKSVMENMDNTQKTT